VALITAVLIVALATILAVDVAFKGYMDQRRSVTAFALDQGFEVALGAEAWAADALLKDATSSNKTDDFTEAWATPIPPIPIDDGEVEGHLEDMQGRFNLNSLVTLKDGALVKNEEAFKRFERLLDLLELEPKWADVIIDWLDTDNDPQTAGAEDSVYTSLTPPYRTPNMLITRASELLALPEFGLQRYRKLEPFVTALPAGTPINLCTASAEVLDSIVEGQREFTVSRQTTIDLRKVRCFPNLKDFEARLTSGGLSADQKELVKAQLSEKTSYFRSTVWVTIGTTQFTLYSLLYRTNQNTVRPILRSFGTT
jgi:general secretion pathway protein K